MGFQRVRPLCMTLCVTIGVLAALACQSSAALVGIDFKGSLYDIDPSTGGASNPRAVSLYLGGICFSPNGVLYALSTKSSVPANSLLTIDPLTGVEQVVGSTGLSDIWEGALGCDPSTGILYGLQNAPNSPEPPRSLFMIDPETGSATIIGSVSESGDLSAMAFDPYGTLYVLDTSSELLLTVDSSTANVLTSVPLSAPLGAVAGMDFDPFSGILYVADGGTDGTNALYTLNTNTGLLSTVGSTGLAEGLSGLAFNPIPEPHVLWVVAIAFLGFLRRRR